MERDGPLEIRGGFKKENQLLPSPSFDISNLNKNKTLPTPKWNTTGRSRSNRGRGGSSEPGRFDGKVANGHNQQQWNMNSNSNIRGNRGSRMCFPKNYRSLDDVGGEDNQNKKTAGAPPFHSSEYRPNFNNRNQPQRHHDGFSQHNFRARGNGQQGSFRGRGQPANFMPRPRGSFNGHNGRGRFTHPGQHNMNRGKWNHNNSNNERPEHKPWMTPEILGMINEKNEVQREALATQNPDKISLLKALRGRLNLAVNDAKYMYKEKNEQNNTRSFVKKSVHYCDACDKSFPDETKLKQHNDEHVVCKLDGCTFTAHHNIITKHVQMQHSTNLFFRVKGYDKPEEIEKWKIERKTNYPTVENIEKKKAELLERRKRGEIMGMRHEKRDNRRNNKFRLDPQKLQKRQIEDKIAHMRKKRRRAVWDNALFSESTLTCQNNTTIITLDSYYMNIEVNNGDLVGKNKVQWVDYKGDEGDISDSESSNQDNIEITDDEDENLLSNVNLNKPKFAKALGGSNPGLVPQPTIQSKENGDAKPLNATGSSEPKSGLLGLVCYSSDSEPEEVPIARAIPSSSCPVVPSLPNTSCDKSISKSKEASLASVKTSKDFKSAMSERTSKKNRGNIDPDWHIKFCNKLKKQPNINCLRSRDIVCKYTMLARFSSKISNITNVPAEVLIDKNVVEIEKKEISNISKKPVKPQNRQLNRANMPSRRRVVFLERLLKDEINTERNYLLQACRYVADKGLVDE